jgi:hypothetical protein
MEDTDVLVDQEVIVASAMICQTPAHGRSMRPATTFCLASSTHIDSTWQSVVRNVASDWSLGQYFLGGTLAYRISSAPRTPISEVCWASRRRSTRASRPPSTGLTTWPPPTTPLRQGRASWTRAAGAGDQRPNVYEGQEQGADRRSEPRGGSRAHCARERGKVVGEPRRACSRPWHP